MGRTFNQEDSEAGKQENIRDANPARRFCETLKALEEAAVQRRHQIFRTATLSRIVFLRS